MFAFGGGGTVSGGHLTENTCGLYQLEEWASQVEHENPVLAELLRDLRNLLDRYDLWLSGDIGADDVSADWGSFRDGWFSDDPGTVERILTERMTAVLESFRKGHTTEDP